MKLSHSESTINYSGHCRRIDSAYDIGCRLPEPTALRTAAEDTLEYFLLERYHLFALKPDGTFLVGQVHHEPYQFCDVGLLQHRQTLTHSHKLPIDPKRTPDHIAWSPGVDVQVSPLQPVS